MRTFQGQNPENRRVHSCKSSPSKRKFHKVPDSVEVHIIDDDDDSSKDYSVEDASKQLVLYNPKITHDKQSDIDHYTLPGQSSKKSRCRGAVLPSIGAYTVQCANCYKWRIVPTKEKYEELRESISQELFVCTRASEWNRALSCDEPEDMSQDGSRVWALDKPNIAQPPPGWDREVRIRGASSKFADVYYTSPAGKRLRSLVEIGRYLAENPHYIREGVNLSQFSFATPKPLQEDYAQKRTFRDAHELPELPEIAQVDPLSWAAPPTHRELLTGPGSSTSGPADINQPEMSDHVNQPEVSEPPDQYRKMRTLKQVSRKCQRTLPAASSPFGEQINQPEMSDQDDLHQPEVSEPPAQYRKMKTLRQVSRKCQRTLPAASSPFGEQSGGHNFIDIDHVLL
ncbi:unnamed protein product [Urochloa decumbens]|uniref:Methyl-CpG-binding domain-containing protein 2 n=1 Tax=Urochloa decumbens TaxID=240449 RepID=A0ABC8ZUG4_9POAL